MSRIHDTIFTGAGVAIITPMNADGSINYALFGRLLEQQVEAKTDAIIVCGTTGESSTMTDDEHIECIRFAVEKIAGRIPVIAGTGSNDTSYAVELSITAEKLGADGLLIVTPYYNKASQRGLVRHFTAIADAVSIPIILYNIPGRTNVNISIDTFVELSKHKNIIGVKEAGGDMNYFAKIIEKLPDFDVYSGDDAMTVPVMALGGKGVISVASNIIPAEMHTICQKCLDNDFLAAGQLQIKYNTLFNSLISLDVNPVPIKDAMNIMGQNVGPCRLPLLSMEESNKAVLKTVLEDINLI